MAIPTYDLFIEPLLRHLAAHPDGLRTGDVYGALAAQVGLSDEERAERLPSKQQPVYYNRVGWAHDRLKRAGLSSCARRGFWKITDAGVAFVVAHPRAFAPDAIERLARVPHDSRLRQVDPALDSQHSQVMVPPASMAEATKSPDERIEEALRELNESVAAELLELIGEGSPAFFEQLVLDLLHAMGYGTDRTALQRVGGSSDGGIDGIISLDRLGLEKVYVQAKRWQGNVGRPELQSFSGALVGRRAKKGVFITTSNYTREAREFAETVADHVVIVDGTRLASLMIEHGVGVTHKPIKIPQVDGDYFETD
jgi:restriction system protein